MLHDLVARALRFYVALLPAARGAPPGITLEITNETAAHASFTFAPVLQERLGASGATAIGVAVYSRAPEDDASDAGDAAAPDTESAAGPPRDLELAVAVAGEAGAVRIASTARLVEMSQYQNPGLWLERILLADRAMLMGVRDAWFINPGMLSAHDAPELKAAVKQAIDALPALRTIVLAMSINHERDEGLTDCVVPPPDLSLLPNVHDPTFSCEHLLGLHLIYDSPTFPPCCATDGSTPLILYKADFSQMFQQLDSSAYCYLEELTVQVPSCVMISPIDIQHLHEYFASVHIQHLEQTSPCPLPLDYGCSSNII